MKSRSGKSLRDPQPRSIDGVLRVWEHGALVGEGSARGPVLADSMGLGKAATAVVAAFKAKMRRVLVLCPKSAIPDWLRELDDWNPRPGVVRVLPRQPHLDFDIGWAITNYERLEQFADDLRAREWDLIVVDEGHMAKEPLARRTVMIYGGMWRDKPYRPIPARKALVVSGTPLKNRIEELFTTLNFLDRATWPDRDQFIDQYYEATDADGHPRHVTEAGRVVQNVAPRDLDALHRLLSRTLLVRTHKDDIPGFPKKVFERVDVPLEDAADRDWFDEKAEKARKIAILLKRARQEHDLDRARELEQMQRELRSSVTQHATRCKRTAILDYLLSFPPEHKIVVIGVHRDLLLDQLADALRQRGRRVVEHNGDSSARAKETVRRFQEDRKVQFFLGQLSVSNLSLTLTASSHVVFCEIPETRADFDQAFDRVHRFGQERECTATVFALDWESAGDEELLDALAHWKEVSDAVLDGREGGAAWNWADGNAENSPGRE